MTQLATPPVAREQRFDWPLCDQAEGLVLDQLDNFLGRNAFARRLRDRMREVAESFPRGGVGDMCIVEQRDDGGLRREVGECCGQALKQPHAGRLAIGSGAADGGDAVKQGCQIVEVPPAQPRHVLRRKSAKVVLDRF